ncbi:hypothetical protein X975_04539, partial [Stegodyphus mimosarum]
LPPPSKLLLVSVTQVYTSARSKWELVVEKTCLLWRLMPSYGCWNAVQSPAFERGSSVG